MCVRLRIHLHAHLQCASELEEHVRICLLVRMHEDSMSGECCIKSCARAHVQSLTHSRLCVHSCIQTFTCSYACASIKLTWTSALPSALLVSFWTGGYYHYAISAVMFVELAGSRCIMAWISKGKDQDHLWLWGSIVLCTCLMVLMAGYVRKLCKIGVHDP
jgi:hypothetical protein